MCLARDPTRFLYLRGAIIQQEDLATITRGTVAFHPVSDVLVFTASITMLKSDAGDGEGSRTTRPPI